MGVRNADVRVIPSSPIISGIVMCFEIWVKRTADVHEQITVVSARHNHAGAPLDGSDARPQVIDLADQVLLVGSKTALIIVAFPVTTSTPQETVVSVIELVPLPLCTGRELSPSFANPAPALTSAVLHPIPIKTASPVTRFGGKADTLSDLHVEFPRIDFEPRLLKITKMAARNLHTLERFLCHVFVIDAIQGELANYCDCQLEEAEFNHQGWNPATCSTEMFAIARIFVEPARIENDVELALNKNCERFPS